MKNHVGFHGPLAPQAGGLASVEFLRVEDTPAIFIRKFNLPHSSGLPFVVTV